MFQQMHAGLSDKKAKRNRINYYYLFFWSAAVGFAVYPLQDLPLHCMGGLHLKPLKFEHICSCYNFFALSSVQIFLIPACCLVCVLKMICKKSLLAPFLRRYLQTRKGHSKNGTS